MLKKRTRIFIAVSFVVGILLALLFAHDYIIKPFIYYDNQLWLTGNYKNKKEYVNGSTAGLVIPNPEDCGEYQRVNFYIQDGRLLTFRKYDYADEAFCLEIFYSEQNYERMKERAFSKHTFLNEVVEDHSERYKMPVTECQIGAFTVKILDDRPQNEDLNSFFTIGEFTDYPNFGFVAFNDELKQIRYGYIVSMSLDYFSDPEDFIKYLTRNFEMGG